MNWGIQIYDIYAIGVGLACFAIFGKYEKRKHFPLRLILSLLIALAGSYFFCRLFPSDIPFFSAFATFFIIFVLWEIAMFTCFRVNIIRLFFGCAIALSLEQFCGGVRELVFTLFPGWTFGVSDNSVLTFFLQTIIIYCPIYILFSFFYLRSEVNWNDEALKTPTLSIMSLIVIFFCLIINRFTKWNYEAVPWYWSVGRSLYAIVCSVLSMFIFFGVSMYIASKKEMAILESEMKMDKARYQEWKEFHELVSVSIHDMRHMLQNDGENNIYAKQMMERVNSYEHHTACGNEAMDILIYEKGNSCLKHEINFTHMVDGSGLKEMEELDVYSLFTNLLDNAINAVIPLEKEKRIINLIVNRSGDVTLIHISNFYDRNQPRVESPVHGFGMKSINMIVNKYDGTLKITKTDDRYQVDICLTQKTPKM